MQHKRLIESGKVRVWLRWPFEPDWGCLKSETPYRPPTGPTRWSEPIQDTSVYLMEVPIPLLAWYTHTISVSLSCRCQLVECVGVRVCARVYVCACACVGTCISPTQYLEQSVA